MEPKGKAYNPSAIRLLPVNTKDYLKTSQEKIPIDEMFFHKYVELEKLVVAERLSASDTSSGC